MVPAVTPDAERVAALSYGHGDDTDKGRRRGRSVDALERALPGWGYQPLRDVNELKNCGLIREFVRTLGRARRVVLVLTDEYLRSVYCMSEMYAVYLESRKVRADFAEAVVPCVLEPDLGIDTWDGRAEWADHWQGVYDRMRARIDRLGRDDLNQWYKAGQWVRAVSDVLAFVSNIVAARGHAVPGRAAAVPPDRPVVGVEAGVKRAGSRGCSCRSTARPEPDRQRLLGVQGLLRKADRRGAVGTNRNGLERLTPGGGGKTPDAVDTPPPDRTSAPAGHRARDAARMPRPGGTRGIWAPVVEPSSPCPCQSAGCFAMSSAAR